MTGRVHQSVTASEGANAGRRKLCGAELGRGWLAVLGRRKVTRERSEKIGEHQQTTDVGLRENVREQRRGVRGAATDFVLLGCKRACARQGVREEG
jgi:hypothetical protein